MTEDLHDLSQQELLIGILTQLQYQNHLLNQAYDVADDPAVASEEADDAPAYECGVCSTTVTGDERAAHAKRQHNYHSDMSADTLTDMYERLDE